eukprot:TRINITY_DN12011_c0_g1_i1.p1 TRINITY_DN12011_c0_g1~~TRINITY_DN12011_c0_g1_i1.p1  ORF type:complete len:1033 (+),score=97.02 TRINITY_DN12011_c0_g1_i1:252-3350(+)
MHHRHMVRIYWDHTACGLSTASANAHRCKKTATLLICFPQSTSDRKMTKTGLVLSRCSTPATASAPLTPTSTHTTFGAGEVWYSGSFCTATDSRVTGPTWSEGLTSTAAARLLQQYGPNRVPVRRGSRAVGAVFARQLFQPVAMLEAIVAAGEWFLQERILSLLIATMLLLKAAAACREELKAQGALACTRAKLRADVTVKRDGAWVTVPAEQLVRGDLVLLHPGISVPADCVIHPTGHVEVDQYTLTGNPVPAPLFCKDVALSGSLVLSGEAEATVRSTGLCTLFARSAAANKKRYAADPSTQGLRRFAIGLFGIAAPSAALLFNLLNATGSSSEEALGLCLMYIFSVLPAAAETALSIIRARACRELAERGIVVDTLTTLENLATLDVACLDHTGTLTQQRLVLSEEVAPIYAFGESRVTCLIYAAMATQWTVPPKSPVDALVLRSADMSALQAVQQTYFIPFDMKTKRSEATVLLPDGRYVQVAKGEPEGVLQLLPMGHPAHWKLLSDARRLADCGLNSVAVARTDCSGQWQIVGLVPYSDQMRTDAQAALAVLQELGVRVKVLTSGSLHLTRDATRRLCVGSDVHSPHGLPTSGFDATVSRDTALSHGALVEIADGFAQLAPHQKGAVVDTLQHFGHAVAMVGDGPDDVPALRRARVGVAVGGACQAARVTAHVVLLGQELSTIPECIRIARDSFQRTLAVTQQSATWAIHLLTVQLFAALLLRPSSQFLPPLELLPSPPLMAAWPQTFHLSGEGLLVLTIVMSALLISQVYDKPGRHSVCRRNCPVQLVSTLSLGSVNALASLFYIRLALDSWNPAGWFSLLDIASLQYGQVIIATYFQLVVSFVFALFSARNCTTFFWNHGSTSPYAVLTATLVLSIITIVACTWPNSEPDALAEGFEQNLSRRLVLLTWIYCVICWLVADSAKVAIYRFMQYFDVFDINATYLRKRALADCAATGRPPSTAAVSGLPHVVARRTGCDESTSSPGQRYGTFGTPAQAEQLASLQFPPSTATQSVELPPLRTPPWLP